MTIEAKLEVRRKLHSSIYRSSDGGIETVQWSGPACDWKKAINLFSKIKTDSVKYYGDIGCGKINLVLVTKENKEYDLTAIGNFESSLPARERSEAPISIEQMVQWNKYFSGN